MSVLSSNPDPSRPLRSPASVALAGALLVLLVSPLVAGCLGDAPMESAVVEAPPAEPTPTDDPAIIQAATAPASLLPEGVGAQAQRLADAYGLDLSTTALAGAAEAGAIRSEPWTLMPLDGTGGRPFAVYRFAMDPAFHAANDSDAFRLDLVPLHRTPEPVPMFVAVLVENEGRLWPMAIHTRLDHHRVDHTRLDAPTEARAATDQVIHMTLFRSLLPPAAHLYLVVGAETDAPAGVGAAVRFVDGSPTVPILPRATPASALVDTLRPTAGEVLAPLGTGQGWQAGTYLEARIGDWGHNETYDASIGFDERAPLDPRPHATARDVTVTFDGGAAPGWGAFAVGYASRDALGTWHATAEAHGVQIDRGGAFVNGGGTALPGLTGVPLVEVAAEGDGPLRLAYDLQVADTGPTRFFLLFAVDLDGSLEALTGVEPGVVGPETATDAPLLRSVGGAGWHAVASEGRWHLAGA